MDRLGGVIVVGLFVAIGASAASAAGETPYTPFPVSIVPGHMLRSAKTDGRYVIWTDLAYLGGPTADNDVFGYDLVTRQPFPVATGAGAQDGAVLGNGTAVWGESSAVSSVDLYGRTLPGGSPFVVTAHPAGQSTPAIDGNLIVWDDDRTGRQSIFGRRLDQAAGSDFLIAAVPGQHLIFPDASGDTVVWSSFQEPNDQGNVYGKNLATGATFAVTTNGAYQLNPKISGDHVVWEDWRDGRRHVYGKNLVTGQEFAVSSGGAAEQIEPAIDGDLVVWMDNRNGTWDVWGRRLSGGNEFAITNTPDLNEAWPDVAGNLVVWEQNAGGMESSIYATFVPEPGAAGALAPFGLFALRRRRR